MGHWLGGPLEKARPKRLNDNGSVTFRRNYRPGLLPNFFVHIRETPTPDDQGQDWGVESVANNPGFIGTLLSVRGTSAADIGCCDPLQTTSIAWKPQRSDAEERLDRKKKNLSRPPKQDQGEHSKGRKTIVFWKEDRVISTHRVHTEP